MSAVFVANVQMTTTECCNCGVTFAFPASWDAHFRKTHQSFYCPAGHGQSYTRESEETKLKRQLAQAQTALEHQEANVKWWSDRAAENSKDAKHQEARARGYKGALKKVEKRIRAGVCPCCNRTFKDLLQHMQTQHPAEIPSTHLAKP